MSSLSTFIRTCIDNLHEEGEKETETGGQGGEENGGGGGSGAS